MTATKTHIAFLPTHGLGHLIPLLEFAKHLVIHHNVHVSFLVIDTEAPSKQHQFFSALPDDLHVINLPPADVSSIINDSMHIVTKITYICQETFKSLGATLIDLGRPKALIIDILSTDAFMICKELGIPVYSFFTGPTKLLALSLYLPELDKTVECEYVDLPGPIQVPGCKPMRPEDLLDPLLNRKDKEYECYLLHASRLPLATGVFVNTWDDLESKISWLNGIRNDPFYKTLPVPPVYPVGPIIKHEDSLNDDAYIMSWLDKQSASSVLFVSLGSGGTLTTNQLTEMALGLEMSKQKFILVVRKPTELTASGTFFNVGSQGDDSVTYLPEGFMKRTAGVGLVVPLWAPQSAILSHKATGGFLSHCGWNSILESIAHGVPMIAWPLYAEQRMNATLLAEELEIAVRPIAVSDGEKKVVKREEVERVVRLVMEGEEGKVMRSKVNQLKQSAAEAIKCGGSSFDLVSSVVQSWK